MALPEQQPTGYTPEGVHERPEEISIPEKIERTVGTKSVPHQPQPLADDAGQVIAQTHPAPADTTAIKIPANQNQAQAWSDGSDDSSSTWLGNYIIRQIKKALHFGKKVVVLK